MDFDQDFKSTARSISFYHETENEECVFGAAVDGSTGAGPAKEEDKAAFYYNSTVEIETTMAEQMLRRQSRYTDFFEAMESMPIQKVDSPEKMPN